MRFLAALRYVLFAAVGVVVASALFSVLNILISSNFDAGTSFVEDWIRRATCEQYELAGTVRDTRGRPVPFAVVEVAYLDQRLVTRSEGDGTFLVTAEDELCDQPRPANVTLLVMADDFRPRRQSAPFDQANVDVTLDARDFRP